MASAFPFGPTLSGCFSVADAGEFLLDMERLEAHSRNWAGVAFSKQCGASSACWGAHGGRIGVQGSDKPSDDR